jgi:hypothetical protein
LGETGAAEFLGHEAGDDNDRSLRENGEETKANHREAEEREADVFDEGCEGRIGDKAPVEMAGIAEELEFVAMEAVTAVGEDVEKRDSGGKAEEKRPLGLALGGG